MAGMTRELGPLQDGVFDVVVVGGGIHGVFVAYDAAARGLRVALLERGDVGSGISFNHQRTIHGGLRALQHGQLRKCAEQIRERRAWARIAPHLLRPLPFLIGTYRGTTRSRMAVRLGFRAYDFIGRGRNADVLPELHLPKGRLESRAATRRLFPGVAEAGLSGGAIWYDYQTLHPDRLTWTVTLAAIRAGVTLATYADVTEVRRDAGRVSGVSARDVLTGDTFDVSGKSVVLTAGAGLASLQQTCGASGAPPLVRAMNLLLDRPAKDIATAAPSRPANGRGRMLTAVPWRGRVLVGTFQSETEVPVGDATPPQSLVETCLAELATAFPALEATPSDVRFIHSGLVPAATTPKGIDLLAESRVDVHADVPGLVSVVGVKYTTARLTAERTVDALLRLVGVPGVPCRTGTTLLPHADVADHDGLVEETCRELRVRLDRDVHKHLAGWYGTEASAVLRCCHAHGALGRLGPGTTVLEGEVLYAVRESLAVRLEDVVFRRTPLGSAGAPPEGVVARAADIMAESLGWSDERRADELARVEARLAT